MTIPPTIDLDLSFPHPLIQGDTGEGIPVFGFSHKDMFIFDPEKSDCGRFDVDPMVAYGLNPEQSNWLKTLNLAILDITTQTLDGMAMATIEKLGLDWKTEIQLAARQLTSEPAAAAVMGMVATHLKHQLLEHGSVVFEPVEQAASVPKP
jgi:hypothetical protein